VQKSIDLMLKNEENEQVLAEIADFRRKHDH